MRGKWMFRLWIAAGIVGGACAAAEAASPWNNLMSLGGVEADANKTYSLSEANGPWMIMACSFSGDGAEKQAQELVLELRKRYKLPAYVCKRRFDLGEAQGRGVDQYGNPKKWQYQKFKDSKDKDQARHPELTEIAVLVGDYPSVDDADAQATLLKIKYAAPQCLEVKDGKETHQDLTGWRMIQKQVYEAIGSEKKKLGPMGHAQLGPNPMLPTDYFVQRKGLDEEIVALNKGVPYSLLACPGKYTVQVATFKGQVVIKQDEIKAIQEGRKEMKGELAEAAKKADQLTSYLRMKGYEAYQFHDHYMSMVTVGSFNSVGTPREDGRTEINPEIHKIMVTFGAEAKVLPGQTVPVTPLKSLMGIPFDIQPMPVEVPKRSISMAMRSRE